MNRLFRYSELGMGQSPIVTRATKVSEEAVPAAKFAVPAGIEIQNPDRSGFVPVRNSCACVRSSI